MNINVNGMSVALKVGADPEVFASKSGRLLSAHGLVQGTKEKPYKVNKGAIQVDGMALEFNIDPSDSCVEFVENIKTVLKELKTNLPEDIHLAIQPTAEFGSRYIQSQPPIAKELGCSADLNAYTGKENETPDAEVPFRTAAGHIHIGWTEHQDIECPNHMDTCREFTKVLDLYLGVPSVILDPDTKRRSLYGAAGAFRSKDYGLEYRVLSNFWLKSDKTIEWAYKQVVEAITVFLKGFRLTDEYVEWVINSSNYSYALDLADQYQLEVPDA